MKQEEKQELYERAELLFLEQNFSSAIVAGLLTTIIAAIAYATIAARWQFASGFAAVGIGIAVGFAMQYVGRGIERKFAVAAAIFTLAGCAIGNTFRDTIFNNGGDFLSQLGAVRDLKFSDFLDNSISYATSFDIVFWLIAIWFAVFLVKRPLSRADSLAIGTHEMQE